MNETGIDSIAGSMPSWQGPPVALFWDQSLVWGLICLETLDRFGIPYRLLSADDIGAGLLKFHRVLLVPGGWASHKVRVLGEAGKQEIRRFIEQGGSYLGFCGGAGLALSGPSALGLVPLERLPLSQRLPSASGGVWIRGLPGHPIWKDLPQSLPVSIWWPSQFNGQPLDETLCLGVYEACGEDFCVADLPVADLEAQGLSWEKWESIYGINLEPSRLLGQPAIMECGLGQGRLILSYPHLETPGDYWGNRLFVNALHYLDREASRFLAGETLHSSSRCFVIPAKAGNQESECVEPLERALEGARELIAFGERHLLWRWRKPWLLNWRRGIRGLEYGTLAVSLASLVEGGEALAAAGLETSLDGAAFRQAARKIEEDTGRFCPLAKLLLLEEKLAIQTGNLTKLGKVNSSVDRMRQELFGDKMNHGGLCRVLMDDLDRLLFRVLLFKNRAFR